MIDLLPFTIQGQERADLEVAGSDVDSLGELAPVAEIATDLPVRIAVVHDEEIATPWLGRPLPRFGGGQEASLPTARRPGRSMAVRPLDHRGIAGLVGGTLLPWHFDLLPTALRSVVMHMVTRPAASIHGRKGRFGGLLRQWAGSWQRRRGQASTADPLGAFTNVATATSIRLRRERCHGICRALRRRGRGVSVGQANRWQRPVTIAARRILARLHTSLSPTHCIPSATTHRYDRAGAGEAEGGRAAVHPVRETRLSRPQPDNNRSNVALDGQRPRWMPPEPSRQD